MKKETKEKQWSLDRDPEAVSEAGRYDSPIPSRKYILQLLKHLHVPSRRSTLVEMFGLTDPDALEAFRRRLRAMERDGQLMYTRKGEYGIVSKMDLIKGTVSANKEGFGFLIPADGSDDLFLSSRQMRSVFDGDVVLASVRGYDRRGRRDGNIVEVLERNTTRIVGRYFEESGIAFVEPDNSKVLHQILISSDNSMAAAVGQFVVVDIVKQPTARSQAQGVIVEILGYLVEPGMEIDIAIRAHDIPYDWPADVLEQIDAIDADVLEEDKKRRIDLRDLPLVTIDGEDARDFDDAVYCERKKSGGWRLIVAIADVSHYVGYESPLDREAVRRGNSVYFPGSVVPMLPEKLSNHLCSLMPKVDRLCMACEISISASGKMSRYRFFEGVMNSAARLTYSEVGHYIEAIEAEREGRAIEEGETPAFERRYGDLAEPVRELYALYKVLRAARAARGAIDFDTVETRILFSENRKIADIVPVQRNEAHKVIEECMLCANVAAAKTLQKHALPVLYRDHEGPSSEKLSNLRQFLSGIGLALTDKKKPTTKDYQQLLEKVKGRPDYHLIQTILLRSMSPAVYAPENSGHFGLGYPAYTHFTSPIRRYPDLIVHRALRYLVRAGGDNPNVERAKGARRVAKKHWLPYTDQALAQLGEHTSMTERRADDATRDAIMRLKCEYMKERVGERYPGVISSVTSFGLFVELTDIYVEGLIHISTLDSDYYHFDPVTHRLTGERTGQVFRLADRIDVIVTRVDLDERKIDFELVSAGGNKGGEKKPRKSKDKKKGSDKGFKKAKGKGKDKGRNGAKRKGKNKEQNKEQNKEGDKAANAKQVGAGDESKKTGKKRRRRRRRTS